MRYVSTLLTILLLLLVVGCSKDEECPECPDVNRTDVEPPYIEAVSGPSEITVGESADFFCDVLTDAPIVRYSWVLSPASYGNEDYFFPPEGTSEGEWTPTGTVPDMFADADTGAEVSNIYASRGCFAIAIEIEDTDGYIERGGTMLKVNPAVPDTDANPTMLYPGLADTIWGSEFTLMDYGLWASGGCMAASKTGSYNIAHNFAFIDSLSGYGDRYVNLWWETGKVLRIPGGEVHPADVIVNFDAFGTMHLWNAAEIDYARYSIYVISRMLDGGLPEKHIIYSKTLIGDGDYRAFLVNSSNEVSLITNFEPDEEYEFWFGVEIEALVSSGAGSAICFDGENGMTKLNYVVFLLQK